MDATIVQFVSKIGQTILRSRVGPPTPSSCSTIPNPLTKLNISDPNIPNAAMTSNGDLQPSSYEGDRHSINAMFDVATLLDNTDFWKNKIPINFDVFLHHEAGRRILLERWVVAYEQR